jgi:hypothetical protein
MSKKLTIRETYLIGTDLTAVKIFFKEAEEESNDVYVKVNKDYTPMPGDDLIRGKLEEYDGPQIKYLLRGKKTFEFIDTCYKADPDWKIDWIGIFSDCIKIKGDKGTTKDITVIYDFDTFYEDEKEYGEGYEEVFILYERAPHEGEKGGGMNGNGDVMQVISCKVEDISKHIQTIDGTMERKYLTGNEKTGE